MNEFESEIDHIQKVRDAMSSGSKSRALRTTRARNQISATLESAPAGTDAFKVATELPESIRSRGSIAVWGMYLDGQLVVDIEHNYVLRPEANAV